MGGITSGIRGRRGGKASLTGLPVVRFINCELFLLTARSVHLVIESADFGVVKYGQLQWPVCIERTSLHFGGNRRWLSCPECSQRRQALYVLDDRLSCRGCLNLRYESQHENVRDRMFRRLYAIRERLGWKGGLDRPNGPKPLRMHRVTFNRLVAEHDSLADMLLGCLGEWIERAELRGVRF